MDGAAIITVERWHDPLIEQLGYPVEGDHVQTYWLPVLGPSAIVLARHLGLLMRPHLPNPWTGTAGELSRAVGLGGATSSLVRTLHRLRQFEMASCTNESDWCLRLEFPPLSRRHLARLPEPMARACSFLQENRRAS